MASACLIISLDGTLSNILATKLAYPEEMTLCCKFCPSDDLLSRLSLKSSKKKQHLFCYNILEGCHLNMVIFKLKQLIPLKEKRVHLILTGKK